MQDLYKMPTSGVETRWITYENPRGEKGRGGIANHGRKGAPARMIKAGETLALAELSGVSGTVRRIWLTLHSRGPADLRGMVVEMYWDGAPTPAVSAPLGDFFCHSLGHMIAFENACFSSPEARSFVCVAPMPFKTGAKILLKNEADHDNCVYWEVDCTINDPHDAQTLYFHAAWRRENLTELRRDMTILPAVSGRGRFLGCNLGMRQLPSTANFWWGEGEVKIYIDGDGEYPTLCGTGTEDYIGSGYGQGLYSNLYQGNHFIGKNASAYGFYRFHIPDPVYFYETARVTIQVMGGPSFAQMLDSIKKDPALRFMKAGDGTEYYTLEELAAHPEYAQVMERVDDWCACAYFYLDKPENGLPPLAPLADRLADLPERS